MLGRISTQLHYSVLLSLIECAVSRRADATIVDVG